MYHRVIELIMYIYDTCLFLFCPLESILFFYYYYYYCPFVLSSWGEHI
ncbi:MAG: hypothetical protein K6253_01710 [Candidatus Liberibacter asiaticus]|nr:hypothetical protein [Candidatus Liberibacter asiaticus]